MKIELKYKMTNQLVMIGLFLLGIGLLTYFIVQDGFAISISGANLDETTTEVIFGILGLVLLFRILLQLVNLIAGLKIKDDFYVHFSEDRFSYPERKMFGMYKYTAYMYNQTAAAQLYQDKWDGGLLLHFTNGSQDKIALSNHTKHKDDLMVIQEELLKRIKSS